MYKVSYEKYNPLTDQSNYRITPIYTLSFVIEYTTFSNYNINTKMYKQHKINVTRLGKLT